MTIDSQEENPLAQSPERSAPKRFVAAHWLRENADDFLQWTADSGVAALNAATMREAISTVVHPSQSWVGGMTDIASCLPRVLRQCDVLTFSTLSEATAYAGLHLLDRYGRVTKVLEHLARVGRLPIRRTAVKVLEVGAGPAPALYAVRDFYSMLRDWPKCEHLEFAGVELAHSIERGEAWDSVLHHLSEQLMLVRTEVSPKALPFSRTVPDFTNFSAPGQRKQDLENRAQSIFWESLYAGEGISMEKARRLARWEGSDLPYAYDLIFMCNFLTQPAMTTQFDEELRQLAGDLTPGGILVILGGTGDQYPAIYAELRGIAAEQGLTDISPREVFDANVEPYLGEVCTQVREYVHAALATCEEEKRNQVRLKLPKDSWDDKVPFELPRYQVLAFVKQGKTFAQRRKEKQTRRLEVEG